MGVKLGGGHELSSTVNNSNLELFKFLEHSHGSRGSRGSSGSGGKKCGSEPQSTRAGGQDDGSLHKLPQIIFCVFVDMYSPSLCFSIWFCQYCRDASVHFHKLGVSWARAGRRPDSRPAKMDINKKTTQHLSQTKPLNLISTRWM